MTVAYHTWAVTPQELENKDLYEPIPQVRNFDPFLKKGSVQSEKLPNNDRVVEFIYFEDQGNAVCEFASQFVFSDANAELRLKRTNMKRYDSEGKLGMDRKVSHDFNVGNGSSGYQAYTKLLRSATEGSDSANTPAAATKAVVGHNILNDNSVPVKWAISDGLTYKEIREAPYNTTYITIAAPFQTTSEYKKRAAILSRGIPVQTFVIRGSPKTVRLNNGDVKIYFQWLQCDPLLPVVLVNACYYFEDATQKLYRCDLEMPVLDGKTGALIRQEKPGLASRQECPTASTSYSDFLAMKSGKYDNK